MLAYSRLRAWFVGHAGWTSACQFLHSSFVFAKLRQKVSRAAWSDELTNYLVLCSYPPRIQSRNNYSTTGELIAKLLSGTALAM